MKELQTIEYRGFGLGHVLLAALTGAAAGAAVVYLTTPASGDESRRRLRELTGGQNGLVALPTALRRATEAARDAFNASIEEAVARPA